MTKASPRRGLLTAVLAAGLVAAGSALGATTAAAQAEEEPTGETLLEVAAEALPTEMRIAVQRDLGINAEVYAERATAAGNASLTSEDLEAELGASFGGSWFDKDSRTLHVNVTDESAAEVVREAGAQAHVGGPSRQRLEAAGDQLASWVRGLPEAQRDLVRGIAVSNRERGLVLTVSGEEGAGVAAGRPDVGVEVDVEKQGGQPRLVDIQGGDGYVAGRDGASRPSDLYNLCSFGFAAYDSALNPLFLTAGHCLAREGFDSVYREPAGGLTFPVEKIGTFQEVAFGNGSDDYATIAPSDALSTSVNTWDGSARAITGVVAPLEGMEVCKSGRTTGFTCGEVTVADTNWEFPDGGEIVSVDGFEFNACVEGGDSGGAIVAGTLAVGMSSAAYYDYDQYGNETCHPQSSSPEFSEPRALGVSLVSDVLPKLDDVHVLTELDAPAVTSPEDGASVGEARPTITGEAAPHATVSVDLAGTPATVTADAGGAWSFQPEGDLGYGEYTVTVAQSLTVGGTTVSSDEGTSRFVVAPTAPTITEPTDGSETEERRPVIRGTAIAEATVRVTVDERDAVEVTADAEGNWQVELDADLSLGDHTVRALQVVDGLESAEASASFRVLGGGGESTPPTTTPPPSGGGTGGGDEDGAGSGGGGGGDDLADTGLGLLVPMLVVGGVALAGGTALVLRFRRRGAEGGETA
ncbi:S1 family peptidase [Actinoalloteichus spitiensis]|uniref:S1 family peptidase n=1 Tax=Actinoalloteichus spitiensis TaxID=252394 RepID=UPI000381467C|nr:S1 family peptidase [Actinoalloteichus spitiensis]